MGCKQTKPKLSYLTIANPNQVENTGEFHLFKLLMIGDSAVGKSSLIVRYTDGHFSGTFVSTIGVDFKVKKVTLDDSIIKLQIWDTAGQERFRTMTSSYYRGSHGILIVYDVTKRETFNSVRKWISETGNYAPENAQMILVGNKCDMDGRVVMFEEGKALADELGILFMEASAKEDIGVDQVFEMLTRQIRDFY